MNAGVHNLTHAKNVLGVDEGASDGEKMHFEVDGLSVVRSGLALKLHASLGFRMEQNIGQKYRQQAISTWTNCPRLHMLGGNKASFHAAAIPVISFVVSAPSLMQHGHAVTQTKLLHPRFVAKLLADMYGIQVVVGSFNGDSEIDLLRSLLTDCGAKLSATLIHSDEPSRQGFSGMYLNGMQEADGSEHDTYALWAQPCFCTVLFNHECRQEQVSYVIEAVKWVAQDGWKLLPQYVMNGEDGTYAQQLISTSLHAYLWESSLFELGKGASPGVVQDPSFIGHYVPRTQRAHANAWSPRNLNKESTLLWSQCPLGLRMKQLCHAVQRKTQVARTVVRLQQSAAQRAILRTHSKVIATSKGCWEGWNLHHPIWQHHSHL
jgi:hypothetical protein